MTAADRPSVTRDGMDPLTRAVSDTLDEYLSRHHGIITSHTNPEDFLTWLRENGHEVRPSVTDNARAEAERRYPSDVADRGLTYPTGAVREHSQAAFVAGAEWAAARAETTTEATERIARQIAATTVMTGMDAREYVEAVQALEHAETTDERVVHNHGPTDGPGLDCPETTLPDGGLRGACLNRAETTTGPWPCSQCGRLGTSHSIDTRRCWDCVHGTTATTTATATARALWEHDNSEGTTPEWRDMAWNDMGGSERSEERVEYELRAQALADAGLLATARTRPTREQVSAAIGDAAKPTQVGFGAVSIAAAVDAVLALLRETDQ